MDDLEFVQSCIRGDKGSWDQFIDKYSRLIYNYIYRILQARGLVVSQDWLRDIFQEIFLSLVNDDFKKLRSFKAKNGASLASWLKQVTINATISHIRKLKPAVSIDEENEDGLSLKDILVDPAQSATEAFKQNERLAYLKDCIGKLDTDDKYFLELHINQGLSLENLKEYLEVSRGAIDMRKSRIIDKLRDCFRAKGFRLD